MNPLVNQSLPEPFEAAGAEGRVIIDIDLGGDSIALKRDRKRLKVKSLDLIELQLTWREMENSIFG